MCLRVTADADRAGVAARLLRAFISAWELERRPPSTALFACTDSAGAWAFHVMGFTPPAVADVVARFGFKSGMAPKPGNARLLVGHPMAERIVLPAAEAAIRRQARSAGKSRSPGARRC